MYCLNGLSVLLIKKGMMMNSVKYVVCLMVIACGMGVLTPWSTCNASGSTVSKSDGRGVGIRMNEEFTSEDAQAEQS
jgi:hypothetical protein